MNTRSAGTSPVDVETLRAEVQAKYRKVAVDPWGDHHFHTGRRLAARLGYPADVVDTLPDPVVEAFAGIANPFSLRPLEPGERVVDVGSGSGFDALLAGRAVGADGAVIGVDMTDEMLARARRNAEQLGATNVEFVEGFAEQLPVEDGWADVVISNGALNLCSDKRVVFSELHRVLRPGGWLQFADIANGRPVPEGALRDIDLWTG
jgi:SAM-dependent methyltransferase